MTTKETLILLAKEKGFIPQNLLISWKEDYYLWMCELKRWLEKVHKTDITINTSSVTGEYYSFIPNFIKGNWESNRCDTSEEALEAGLLNALNLITE